MKTSVLFLFVVLFFVCRKTSLSQTTLREGEIATDTVIALLQKIDDPASVVLFRNDQYVISAPYGVFKSNFADWINKNPDIQGDSKLFELIEKSALHSQVIDAAMIADKNNLINRLKFRMADLLQHGLCMIYDKRKYQPISNVTVQTYRYNCGNSCGEGGGAFY